MIEASVDKEDNDTGSVCTAVSCHCLVWRGGAGRASMGGLGDCTASRKLSASWSSAIASSAPADSA